LTGFFAGTALQWVLFWTDQFDTEFPPMGGALLGVIAVLAYRYAVLRSYRFSILLGALVGNVNAFWCNKAPLLFWDIPRDYVTSWSLASLTFLVALACTLAAVKTIDRAAGIYTK
jgi:hypothetical protein